MGSEAKNVSSVSLWLFFYGLVALFLCGCEIDTLLKQLFWSFLTGCTIIYSVLGWIIKCQSKELLGRLFIFRTCDNISIFVVLILLERLTDIEYYWNFVLCCIKVME